MTAKKYTKKPVQIEAIHYTGSPESYEALTAWIDSKNIDCGLIPGDDILIKTLEGTMRAHPGDYIIRGVQGEYYPCKSDIFAETYQEVEGMQ